jgi:hypothetical protein
MDAFGTTVEQLQRLAWLGRPTEVLQLLKALVPSYAPEIQTIEQAGEQFGTVKVL